MFNSDKWIIAEVKRWLAAQDERFNLDGVTKLVERWRKCTDLEGRDVDK